MVEGRCREPVGVRGQHRVDPQKRMEAVMSGSQQQVEAPFRGVDVPPVKVRVRYLALSRYQTAQAQVARVRQAGQQDAGASGLWKWERRALQWAGVLAHMNEAQHEVDQPAPTAPPISGVDVIEVSLPASQNGRTWTVQAAMLDMIEPGASTQCLHAFLWERADPTGGFETVSSVWHIRLGVMVSVVIR